MTPATRARPRPARPPAPADPRSPRRVASVLFLLVSVAAVLAATLYPSDQEGADGWDGCVLCGERGLADALLNVALFAPLGVALARLRVPAWAAAGIAALLSAGVEAAQLVVPGRDPSPPDVLFNTAGALVGYAVGRAAEWWLRPSDRAAGGLSLAWSALFALAVALTGVLTAPSTTDADLVGQWNPDLGDFEHYQGHVLSARVGTVPVEPWSVSDSRRLRDALRAGAATEVVMLAGPPPRSPSPLLRIVDWDEEEMLFLAAERSDVIFGYRMRAADLRLDRPLFRAPGALRGVRIDEKVRVTVERTGRRVAVRVGDRTTVARGLDAGSGWTLLFFSTPTSGGMQVMLDGVWIALWMAPLGLWLRRRWEAFVAIGIAIVGMAVVPGMVGLGVVGGAEMVGAAVGLMVGIALRRL